MEINERTAHWTQTLQVSGYRLTAARLSVVNVIAASQKALNPMDAYLLARQECPGLGLVTVYRTLEKLEELGLVVRVHAPDGCGAYLSAAEGHEHLIICTHCQRAEYFAGDDLHPLMDRVAAEHGYQIQDHWLQLFVICPECRENS
jgi:Fe2+ or Zn2+ uptake regulation protein